MATRSEHYQAAEDCLDEAKLAVGDHPKSFLDVRQMELATLHVLSATAHATLAQVSLETAVNAMVRRREASDGE